MVGNLDLDTASNLLVAAGTGGLAVFTWRLARGTVGLVAASTRQAEQTERAAQATEASAVAAADAVRETSRARLDALAPRVLVLCGDPDWPPLIDPQRSRMPFRNEHRLFAAGSLSGSPPASGEFVFDRDRDHFLWFRCEGIVRNEGNVTARVRLNGEARFVKIESGHMGDPPERRRVPLDDKEPLNPERLLEPGEDVHFEWATGRTLGEWADAAKNPDPPKPNGALHFSVTIIDPTGLSVEDTVYMTVAGKPIKRVPDSIGNWRVAQERQLFTHVWRTVRHYLNEGSEPPEPPWGEVSG